jgi:hypothetical protein
MPKATLAGRFGLAINFITFGSHDEIILMQASNFVRPPDECYSSPLGNDQRMVVFFLSNCADFVRKLQRLDKVLEFIDALQSFHPIDFFDLPLWDLWLQYGNVALRHGQLTGAASYTFSSSKIDHKYFILSVNKRKAIIYVSESV